MHHAAQQSLREEKLKELHAKIGELANICPDIYERTGVPEGCQQPFSNLKQRQKGSAPKESLSQSRVVRELDSVWAVFESKQADELEED